MFNWDNLSDFFFYKYGDFQLIRRYFKRFSFFFALEFGGLEINLQLCTPKQRKRVRENGIRLLFRGKRLGVCYINWVKKLA
jgi:hypothetical protein